MPEILAERSEEDVLTLAEAASFLRVAETEVLRLAERHDIPAQHIGGEWRFLKKALVEWLRFGPEYFRELRRWPWLLDHPMLEELLYLLEKRLLGKLNAEKRVGEPGSKQAVLEHFGVFKDENDLEEVLTRIRASEGGRGMIILDTDTMTHFSYGKESVRKKVESLGDDEQIAVTLITQNEMLRGRADNLLKAADEEELKKAVERYYRTEALLAAFLVLPVDDAAIKQFGRLRKEKKLKKIGRADLLIACIALAHDALLVSRNEKDFKLVAGLRLENWVA